jgi:hypothetical protein
MHARPTPFAAFLSVSALLACSKQVGLPAGRAGGGEDGQSPVSSHDGGTVGQASTNAGGTGGAATTSTSNSSDLFTSVSTGSRDACCGIKADGAIVCWGASPTSIPGGTFRSVSLGAGFACGIRTDDTIVCWGDDAPTPPQGTFTSISAGTSSGCAVRTDGVLACWGDSTPLTTSAPEGAFTSVSVEGDFACALRADGTVACWGAPDSREMPFGTFTSFSVGFPMMCGVKKSDGTIACFVRGSSGCTDRGVDCADSTPPDGTFTSVSAGLFRACGVKMDGAIVCWGIGMRMLPAGTYASVSVGTEGGLCGVRTDGTVACTYTPQGPSGWPGMSH